ncbi:MAG: hypothetical protein V7K40_14400 [Nostoc sp.]
MGQEERPTTQPLTLVCFNTFQLKAQNPAREVLANTKKHAIGQPRGNHLMVMENS